MNDIFGSVGNNAKFFSGVFSWMKDLFGGLGYFTGTDFTKAIAKGFMA